MIPPSHHRGRPGRRLPAVPILLLCTSALAGCAHLEKPPEIAYDDAAPATLKVDPPAPVTVVELPKPLPLPGQLKPVERGRPTPEAADPTARVALANAAARMQPVRNGFINAVQVYPFTAGALYQVYAAPGQITDIALQPGEQLVGSGPVAAGDTVRWIIGDTESGTGAGKQVHILVKPTRPELTTNLVINTDRRTYHMELRATERTYMASVSWSYPQDQLIALRRQNAEAQAAQPVASGVDLGSLNFRYAITGDAAPWRPLRAFDDGRQVFIEFPRGIAQGEMPPLFVVGPEGDTSELVNYRVRGNHMIVDRLFAAAELRFGSSRSQQRVRIVRTDGRPSFMSAEDPRNEEASAGAAEPEEQARPLTGEPAAAMRLRAEPPRVTRLSRKVLAGIGLAAGLGVGGALVYGLQSQHGGKAAEELLSTGNRNTPDGLNALPKDYSGVPKLGPPLPGDLGRPILSAQNGGQPVTAPGIGAPVQSAVPDPEAERRRQEQERRRQELEAARTAKLFTGTEARLADNGMPNSATPSASAPQPDLASLGLAPQPATPSAQQRQQAFLDQAPDKRTVSPDRVASPASPNVLQAGAVIPAALITGIRSDLPGQVTAQVTENVYDSPTGRILLVPQGTRVVGQYDNGVGFGQRRVLLVWTRLIFPNGRSIVLERQPGAGAEGYAGLEDGVDHHWWDLAKAAVLSTLLSVGAQAGSSGEESDIARAIRQGASDGVSQVGRQVVGRQLDIAPTLTIRPGFPVRVLVTRDLVLEAYKG